MQTERTPPYLVTLNENQELKIINTVKQNKFLGGIMQEDLQWQAHLDTGQDSLLTTVRKKLGALKYVGRGIPRKCSILLANGLIMSKILYLIPLYRGTFPKYLKKLQAVQNNTIRWITRVGKRKKRKKHLLNL